MGNGTELPGQGSKAPLFWKQETLCGTRTEASTHLLTEEEWNFKDKQTAPLPELFVKVYCF